MRIKVKNRWLTKYKLLGPFHFHFMFSEHIEGAGTFDEDDWVKEVLAIMYGDKNMEVIP